MTPSNLTIPFPRLVLGIFSALCVVALFSSFVLVSRLGFRSSLAPFDLLALRFCVAGSLMFPIFWRHRLMGLSYFQAASLAATGGLGFAAFAYAGFSLAPASHGSSLIHGTLPLTTLLLSYLFLAERVRGLRVVGALIIVSGILLLAGDSLVGINVSQLGGDAYLFCASLCWSAYGLLAKRFRVSVIPAAALVAVLSALIVVPCYVLLGGESMKMASPSEVIWQALFQGIAIGILSLVAYTQAVATLGAANTTLFAAAAPVLTTILSVPLLGESPSVMTWIGVFCVTVGIVASSFGTKASAPSKTSKVDLPGSHV